MLFAVWLPLAFQLLFPIGLLAWLAFGEPGSRLSWVLRVVTAGLYLMVIACAGLWLVLPWYTPVLYSMGLLLAIGVSIRRLRLMRPYPRGLRETAGAVALTVAAAVVAVLLALVISGRRAPTDAVQLSFPLRSGTYLVLNGGRSKLVNAHLETLTADERFVRWRGQSYGVDVAKLGPLGFRASGILPGDPAAYAIFGDVIYAPCAGTVLFTLDGMPEMRPPEMDRRNMAGNHVILECGGVWVVLGHLRDGSVSVRTGDPVDIHDRVGRVGNSGNSGEPHLHIHAQRPGTLDAPLSGDPVPISFGGEYPSRNTRIRVARDAAPTPSA